MKSIVRTFLVVVTAIVAAGCTAFFFHPSREVQESPAVKLFPHRDVVFTASDGVPLHGWYFPAERAVGSVLVLHGNAQNLSTHVNGVLWLVKEGFNLFIVDYRGYGWSGGEPDLKGVHADADAALEKLLTLPETDPDRVAVLGQSLGGSIAVYTVARSRHKARIRALVVDSAFSSYRLIAREKAADLWPAWPFQYPISWTIDNSFSAEKWIGQVPPVTVVLLHGMADEVVPMHHGRMLNDAAREPKQFWLTATPGHIRSFADENVRTQLAAFLRTALTATGEAR